MNEVRIWLRRVVRRVIAIVRRTGDEGPGSSLVVLVPQAEHAVGALRNELDPGRAMPAHITVLYPFAPEAKLTRTVMAQLRELCAGVDAFEFALAGVEWFDERVVYLAPKPAEPFRALTTALAQSFPQYPPYRGEFADIVPHLCVAEDAALERMRQAADTVGTHLPIRGRVTELHLMTYDYDRDTWHRRATFALRQHD